MRAMGQKTMPVRPRRAAGSAAKTPRQALAREDWIGAAKDALIRAGINAVKVVPLARRLHVTRGSFYWHFKSLSELHKELLKAWERTNTEPFERALLTGEAPHAIKEFQTVIDLWVQEKDYCPAFDTAVRDWARIDGARPAAHRFAARIYEDMGAIDLAAEAAERAADRAPGDAREWERLGRLRLRLRLHDPVGAVDALRKAQALRPSVEGLLDLALASALCGDLGGEVSACEAATQLEPRSADAWTRLAHALARTDRIGECLAACETALKLGAGAEVLELRERMREVRRRVLPAA